MTRSSLWILSGLVAVLAAATTAWADRAEFNITRDVVAEDVEPFTVTISNGPSTVYMQNTGFEPFNLRHRIEVTADGENTLHSRYNDLNLWGHLREGAWDGAEVDVFRVIDGKMTLVRSDRVGRDNGGPFCESDQRPVEICERQEPIHSCATG